ncbi:MAG: hypothetical protein LBT86_10435 [Deltaproteobacteria bacterium]|nr:hypothetical protein [Deltaproteobacteria bacterium]
MVSLIAVPGPGARGGLGAGSLNVVGPPAGAAASLPLRNGVMTQDGY